MPRSRCRHGAEIGCILKSAAAMPLGPTSCGPRPWRMRLRFAMIVNRSELQGQKRIVVPVKGKQVSLQFALFAVQVPKKAP